MYLKDILTPLKIRKLHRNSPVETSGPCQRRVQRFRTVGCCQNDDAVVSFKAVHLRKQLIQCLLPLIVSAVIAAAGAFSADRINFINKNNTGSLFLCLLEQITHLGSAHSDKHLYKLRAGHGEKRHIRFACNCLCQHGFTGSGRAYKKHTLRHLRTDLLILRRILQIGNNLLKIFLGFLLACHIRKLDSVRGLHIDLGIAFPHAKSAKASSEGHAVIPGHVLEHLLAQNVPHDGKDHNRKNPVNQEGEKRRLLLNDFTGKICTRIIQPLYKSRVIHQSGFIDGLYFLRILTL